MATCDPFLVEVASFFCIAFRVPSVPDASAAAVGAVPLLDTLLVILLPCAARGRCLQRVVIPGGAECWFDVSVVVSQRDAISVVVFLVTWLQRSSHALAPRCCY